ncbi:MAG: glycosyltransferase family 2 protein [Cyclobacteriaceae bacterium]|nr:glycosyltransferase family 2 protein [Cyclobacteriaceae bacterium SS2]
MDLVTIIMPVKNAAPFLAECIDSMMRQTYDEWELIAVDDHSTDRSERILLEYTRRDSRIRYLKNGGHGIIHALKTGYAYAKGIYITRMDADDIMPDDRLMKMVTVSKNSSKSIVTGLVKYFGDQPISEGYLKYENWINETSLAGKQWQQIYRECVIASPNWMVRKSELDKIGGFDHLTYPEDYHLVFKWYQNQFKIYTIPEVTLHWREHVERTSRNSNHYQQPSFFHLKINQFIENDLRTDNLVLWGRNEKTRLTAEILDKAGIPYHQFDLQSFDKTKDIKSPQILVGVYPELTERLALEDYLSKLSLFEGTDWWYI